MFTHALKQHAILLMSMSLHFDGVVAKHRSKLKEIVHYPCVLELVPNWTEVRPQETWSAVTNASRALPWHMPNGLNGEPRTAVEEAAHQRKKQEVGSVYNPESDMLFSDLPLTINASILHRHHVLEWGDTLYRLADPWTPAKVSCPAVYFGAGGFLTGRHGSRVLMLLLGLRYAKIFNFCTMVFSKKQRQQVEDLITLPESVDLSPWLNYANNGATQQQKCTKLPARELEALVKGCIKANTPLNSLKHFQLFDPRGDELTSLRQGMVELFGTPYRVTHADADGGDEMDQILKRTNRDDVLVIHMRSGDVWTARAKWPEHVQPPCAYYTAAFRNGPGNESFKHAVVIAQDDSNPCVQYITKALPHDSVTFVLQGTLKTDASIMGNARHLATSASALPLSLAYINPNLQSLHIPFGKIENRWNYWAVFAWSERPMPYVQYLYSFPSFPNDHVSRWIRLPRLESFCLYEESLVMHRRIDSIVE
eukprot:m.78388 g.78388  ORF g.78388 m.78388 type:complete len:480 (-) comp25114_c0_seq2:92-1531(-)